MTSDEVKAVIGKVLHEFQYDYGNPAAEAVLSALASAGLVIGERVDFLDVFPREMYPVSDGRLSGRGLALVRVVSE